MSKIKELDTSIYIDGLNLHHGSLKETQYEYRLDLSEFCRKLLQPRNRIVQINYFTSRPIGGEMEQDELRQYDHYIEMLRKIPEINIVTGLHKWRIKRGYIAKNRKKKATIIVPEEKYSDVNLAVHLIDDACQNKFECAVIISNDADMLGAMKMLRERYPNKLLGLAVPENQRILDEMTKYPNFIREVRKKHLEGCLLS